MFFASYFIIFCKNPFTKSVYCGKIIKNLLRRDVKMRRIGLIIFLLLIISTLYSCGHEHSYSDWSVKTEATCSSEGEETRECECGETETRAIEKKEHRIIATSPIAPTCTNAGQTAGAHCSVCGIFTTEPQILPPTHNYIPSVISAPTCTAKGVTQFNCSACEASYTEESEPLGHNIINETCTTPKTCTVCGSTFGLPLGHTTKRGLCERCNEFVEPKINIPSLPLSVSVTTDANKTEMSVTDLSYNFTGNNIEFTYSGIKTKDEGIATNGRYFCGFSYRLYDDKGNLVASGISSVSDLSVGESFKDERFYIVLLTDIADFYTLIITDCVN